MRGRPLPFGVDDGRVQPRRLQRHAEHDSVFPALCERLPRDRQGHGANSGHGRGMGEKGASLRRGNWNVKWRAATAASGMNGLRFHDLRHTGNTLAAATGASTKELMVRMGHSSARAALIYQHATVERERLIATALDEMFVADPFNA